MLRSSGERAKRLLQRQMIKTVTSTLTTAASSSKPKNRKRKADSTTAEEAEESAAKKPKTEPEVTITRLSKHSVGKSESRINCAASRRSVTDLMFVSSSYKRIARQCTENAVDAYDGHFTVKKVKRIENEQLETLFKAKQKELTKRRGRSKAQVQTVTTARTRRKPPRLRRTTSASTRRGSFGAGMYVTPFSDLGAQYSNTGTLLQFDVSLGRSYTASYPRDKDRPLKPGHDSHRCECGRCECDASGSSSYDSEQLLPRYIIQGEWTPYA
jgi:hypothetical protein